LRWLLRKVGVFITWMSSQAFLNGDLKEEVYVHLPPGFVISGNEGKMLRLRKALYGLW
jgi:hypothetical protein